MPDSTRLAATDSPVYDGKQLPRFFDAEQLCAQGLKKEDLVKHPEWFSTASEYRSVLDLSKAATTNSEDRALTLATTEAGDKYKDRANITLRIPQQWGPHSLIATLLRASNQIQTADVKGCKTMADQLKLLKTLFSWEDINLSGTVNETFGDRLSNALELIYFGVNAIKA